MEDEAVEIMYSEESEASQLRLLKAIESWASKESQRSELELTVLVRLFPMSWLILKSLLPRTADNAPS